MRARFAYFVVILVLALVFSLGPVHAGGKCYESAGGVPIIGALTAALPGLIATYREEFPDQGLSGGRLYGEDHGDRFYFKMCNDPNQINHYEGTLPAGSWHYVASFPNQDTLLDKASGYKLIKIELTGGQWQLHGWW